MSVCPLTFLHVNRICMAAAKDSKKIRKQKVFQKSAKSVKEAKFVYKPVPNEAYVKPLEIYIYATNRSTYLEADILFDNTFVKFQK